jgi:acyl-CoA synthetase (AMP-forming)/AMP-acid ligase II
VKAGEARASAATIVLQIGRSATCQLSRALTQVYGRVDAWWTHLSYVRENLARFNVPREVVFVDEVPHNPTGKVVKAKLPQRDRAADEGQPDRQSRIASTISSLASSWM